MPAAPAASSRLWPGPPETVFSTKASYRVGPVKSRSHRSAAVPFGRSTSIWCPQDRSTSTTAPGITSFSYRSSTMKHRRAGVVRAAWPSTVVVTKEMPVLVTVLCLVELLIVSATPVCPGRRSAWHDSQGVDSPYTGTPGLGWYRSGDARSPPRWGRGAAARRGSPRWSGTTPRAATADPCGGCRGASPRPTLRLTDSADTQARLAMDESNGVGRPMVAGPEDPFLPSGRESDRVGVLGHRGFPAPGRPENSVAAVTEALRQGADGVEIDVRLTADGVL